MTYGVWSDELVSNQDLTTLMRDEIFAGVMSSKYRVSPISYDKKRLVLENTDGDLLIPWSFDEYNVYLY